MFTSVNAQTGTHFLPQDTGAKHCSANTKIIYKRKKQDI